ncbi:DUF2958 domain-containing protein [Candidatus Sulfurimonas baltica]|uniref:DUF2958 domain-containing protein n=1 Tax=Candidatus Sulfurimonas baltica TaxID=2740404 RepID=A0A7S7LV41_9BACT|nr:DUF2958 domain-containing protein [Candidatus Sulfurimonas baltica]QOY51968.1 DUF2958 domain-containing protein [Candidatus Sulfurimonas baltica]
MSKLIPDEFLVSIPDLYQTEGSLNPICHIKLFTPDSNWSWYIIEFSKADKNTCYGYVQGLEHELGYFNLSELESARGQLGLAIELDLSFIPTAFAIIKNYDYESS